MGPLAKLWLAVDEVTNHVGDENPPKLPVEEAQQLLEQSIMMLGQTNNLLLYERRKNALSSVMNNTKGSYTLKEQTEVLSKSSDLLFGNDFRDHVVDSSKAKRKLIEAFTREEPVAKKPFSKSPSYPSGSYQHSFKSSPRRGGYYQQQQNSQKYGYGGQNYRQSGSSRGSFFQSKGKTCTTKGGTFEQQTKTSRLNGLTQVHKAIKLLFKHMSVPSLRLEGRLKSFLPPWQILTQDRQILSIVEGFEIPLSSKPMQEKLPISMKTTLEQTELIDKEVLQGSFNRFRDNS